MFRELLIHDGDTRGPRGIRRQEAAATQNRNPHGLEVSFINRIHRRIKILSFARHLKSVRHEGDAVKVVGSERNVLGETPPLNSGMAMHTLGRWPIELLRS